MRRRANLLGQTFGRLTVIDHDVLHQHRDVCKCECGNVVPVFRRALLAGNSKSCGCAINRQPKVTYCWSLSNNCWIPDK